LIDYWMILWNLFWISGFALLVAVWSLSYYEAKSNNTSVLGQLKTPAKDRIITIALLLICAGLAATGSSWWIRLIMIIIGLAILVDWIQRRRKTLRG